MANYLCEAKSNYPVFFAIQESAILGVDLTFFKIVKGILSVAGNAQLFFLVGINFGAIGINFGEQQIS